jgi:hypothetical protein
MHGMWGVPFCEPVGVSVGAKITYPPCIYSSLFACLSCLSHSFFSLVISSILGPLHSSPLLLCSAISAPTKHKLLMDPPQRPRNAQQKISSAEWESHFETIRKLFLTDGYTLENVRGIMEREHQFHATYVGSLQFRPSLFTRGAC